MMTDFWTRRLESLRRALLVLLFGAVLTVNLIEVFIGSPQSTSILAELRFIAMHPRLSYDEKMSNRWGRYYDLMSFAAKHTEPDSTVLLPVSMDKGGITTYFLYPRRWQTYDSRLGWDSLAGIDYVVIDWPSEVQPPFDAAGLLSEVAGSGDMSLLAVKR